jgi:hypothetical protein
METQSFFINLVFLFFLSSGVVIVFEVWVSKFQVKMLKVGVVSKHSPRCRTTFQRAMERTSSSRIDIRVLGLPHI